MKEDIRSAERVRVGFTEEVSSLQVLKLGGTFTIELGRRFEIKLSVVSSQVHWSPEML